MLGIKTIQELGSPCPNIPTTAPRTPPAIVAIPPTIKQSISDFVILSKYGLTRSGALSDQQKH